jgi:hypothetical protein
MGRPHIEPLVDTDVRRRRLTLPGWKPGIQARTLSMDPENGSCTQVVEFAGGFKQPEGYSTSEWEFFILDGAMKVGDQILGKDHYLFVPAGHHVPAMSTRGGCKAIWFWNDHFPSWQKADGHQSRAVRTDRFTSVNANDSVRWTTPNFVPQTEPGVFIKLLHFDEATGAFTGLYNMCAGFWQDNVSFHDCMEEAYHIWGESWIMQFGYLPTGGYFYRPPYINHGPFQCQYGTYAIFRTDSWLVNHFNFDPFKTPDECRLDVVSKMRRRQPNLMDWVFLHADEFVP